MVKRKQKLLILLTVGAIMSVPMSSLVADEAQGVSRACQNSAECMAAVAAEQEANANAAAAASTANAFQQKVYDLNAEIAAKQAEIAETQAQIEDLNVQIRKTEQKLEDEQEALAELLVNMHFEGDAEPITILAGSTSISDLAEKQARNEVVKQQIALTAQKVRETKAKLESDKERVEALLVAQKTAQAELVTTRAEQQALVEKYEHDAASYEAVAAAAKEAQKAAEKAEQEAHPELYRGSSYTGDNTYPWQADCPSRWDDYVTYWYGSKIGGLVCECVSYVGWKAYEWYGLTLAWGNAYSWDDNARAWGYTVNHTPAAGTIGQSDGGTWGHVFWVEGVNADGSINVTEYNNAYATYLYSGSYHYGDFGSRKIAQNELWQYNFIHL